jgi:hypothetical protein
MTVSGLLVCNLVPADMSVRNDRHQGVEDAVDLCFETAKMGVRFHLNLVLYSVK